MSDLVIDSSVALAVGLDDETSLVVERLLKTLGSEDQFWVPPLFWSEVGNGLEMARRRGRCTEAAIAATLNAIDRLPLMTDWLLGVPATRSHRRTAAQYSLTAYDACYLELAERRDLPLATLDTQLARAAGDCGVEVFAAG